MENPLPRRPGPAGNLAAQERTVPNDPGRLLLSREGAERVGEERAFLLVQLDRLAEPLEQAAEKHAGTIALGDETGRFRHLDDASIATHETHAVLEEQAPHEAPVPVDGDVGEARGVGVEGHEAVADAAREELDGMDRRTATTDIALRELLFAPDGEDRTTAGLDADGPHEPFEGAGPQVRRTPRSADDDPDVRARVEQARAQDLP